MYELSAIPEDSRNEALKAVLPDRPEDEGLATFLWELLLPQKAGHHLDGKIVNLSESSPEGQASSGGSRHLGSNCS